MKKLLYFSIALGLLLSSWGCSAIATKVLPDHKRVIQGETYLGDPIAYGYKLKELPQALYKYELEKFPICYELSEKLIVSGKPQRTAAAFLGITTMGPLSFIGAFDAIVADEIAKQSVHVEKVEEHKTGRVLPCGERTKAANEEFVIQFSGSKTTLSAKTDEHGVLDLSHILFERSGDVYFNLFLKSKDYYYYITTVFLVF